MALALAEGFRHSCKDVDWNYKHIPRDLFAIIRVPGILQTAQSRHMHLESPWYQEYLSSYFIILGRKNTGEFLELLILL